MFERWAGLVAALVVLIALPGPVEAGRRGYRRGPVRSVFGTLYDTRSPEWRTYGGNMFTNEELMRQNLLARQQRMSLRRRPMLQGPAAGKGSTNPAGAGFVPGEAGRQDFAPSPAPVRKKRRTYQPTGEAGKVEPSSAAAPRVDSAAASSAPSAGARTLIGKRPGDP